jgi:SNF2 family DNA or RNA helicase
MDIFRDWFSEDQIAIPHSSAHEENCLEELRFLLSIETNVNGDDFMLDDSDRKITQDHGNQQDEDQHDVSLPGGIQHNDSQNSDCEHDGIHTGDTQQADDTASFTIVAEGSLEQGYRLLRAGATAPRDDQSYLGLITRTPPGVALKLFDYQLHALNRILEIFGLDLGALVAYDMGLGKTLIIIGKATLTGVCRHC